MLDQLGPLRADRYRLGSGVSDLPQWIRFTRNAEWDGTRIVERPGIAARLDVGSNQIFHALEDRKGATWYCTAKGVARQTGGSLERIRPFGIKNGPEAYAAYEDAEGAIWFIHSDGLYRATGTDVDKIVPDLAIKSLAFDRDGNVWIATDGAGLIRFKIRTVRMFTTADGLPGGVPMAVLSARDGKVWVGIKCGGLSEFDGHRFHTYAQKEGLTQTCVFSLAEDANGGIWAGTYFGGVYRFRDGRFTDVRWRSLELGRRRSRIVCPANHVIPAGDVPNRHSTVALGRNEVLDV
jgi:ligand-binding sensor domain-containing protein